MTRAKATEKNDEKKAAAQPEDNFTIHPDGRIVIRVDGTDHDVKRPKIGVLWALEEQLAEIGDAEKASAQWQIDQLGDAAGDVGAVVEGKVMDAARLDRLVKLAGRIDPHESAKKKKEIDLLRIEWWHDHAFPTLCPDLAAVPILELPVFLADGAKINEARAAWAGNPPVPGAG